MRKSVFGQVGHGASGFLDNVVGGAGAFGNHCAGDVGDVEQYVAYAFFGSGQCIGSGFLAFLECGYFGLLGFGGSAVSGFHEGADGFGVFFELGGGIVVLQLEATAFGVQFEDAVYGLGAVKALDSKTADDVLRVLFDLLKCKHCCVLYAICFLTIVLFGQEFAHFG